MDKVYAVQDNHVLVIKMQYIDPLATREFVRQSIKETLGTEWVWFQDEIGTALDPVTGPTPQFGLRVNRN